MAIPTLLIPLSRPFVVVVKVDPGGPVIVNRPQQFWCMRAVRPAPGPTGHVALARSGHMCVRTPIRSLAARHLRAFRLAGPARARGHAFPEAPPRRAARVKSNIT